MKGLVVVALLVAVALAGCTAEKTPAAPEVSTSGATDRPAASGGPASQGDGSALPVWQVGDWWSYQVAYASGESYTAKLIVYDEDATNYYVTADSRELILRAAFTHYPTVGTVKKSDLSESIHGVAVQSLRFPMENGTWSGTYRDFPATWTTTAAPVTTAKGPLPGFVTTMRNSDDGLVRIANGWSAETKWYTNFTFDFDGVAPADVTYTLQDWGSNHTGTFPLVEVIDGVHRPFPTLSVAPPDPAAPPSPPDPQGALDVVPVEEGSSILWGFFAAAGGAGYFRMNLGHESSGAAHHLEWQPSAAGGTFQWVEITAPEAGDWGLSATGLAQFFSFLFVEAYEVRTTEGSL